jgi:chromosome segregation ATPase
MALASALAARPAAPDGLPVVRLEVRAGGGRPTVYEVGDGGFLIGGVPGCDLRLPGPSPAPVLCLISRHARGASLRKLAPVHPVAVNGRPVGSTFLGDGDRVALGPAEVVVSVTPAAAAPDSAAPPDERLRELTAREKEVQEAAEQLEEDRVLWYRRRDEIEAECLRQTEAAQQELGRLRQAENDLAAARADVEAREQAVREARDELARQKQEIEAEGEEATRRYAEAAALRREVETIREQLYQRYRELRVRLDAKRQAVHAAARKLIDRKRALDAAEARFRPAQEELALKQAALEARAEQFARERSLLEEQHTKIVARQKELQKQLAGQLAECEERDRRAAEERAALEKGQQQLRDDLLRQDRARDQLEQRRKRLEQHAKEVDLRYEQLQRDTRELEEQAVQMDEWHNRLADGAARLEKAKGEHDAAAGQLGQRAAALEGQQAMLATLRTRLERMREELRRQEQALGEQRAEQESGEADLKERLAEASRLRQELDNDRELHAAERRRFEEGRSAMETAVARLRQAQDAVEAREAELKARQEEQDAVAADQAEQTGLLQARTTQLEEVHARLTADRQALRDREEALARSEQALQALQEQLRRRSEDFAEREKALSERESRVKEEAAAREAQAAAAEQQRSESAAELEALRQELASLAQALEARGGDLDRREGEQRAETERSAEAGRSLTVERQALASERLAWGAERQAAADAAERDRQELAAARAEAQELARQLPELEARAAAGLDRLLRAREQLRGQLAEVHGYARQGRDDLEAARTELQAEAERVRRQGAELHAARDEHRLAAAAFRQEVIEWQGKLGELRAALAGDATRLERRRAEVDEEARRVASDSARLAEQAEQLRHKERMTDERRTEVERHLDDMREWYRKKLRELSGVDAAAAAGEAPDVLPLAGDDPADRGLGELLRSLGLVDADALAALLGEARRQRRSLRHLLLAGNYLTLYQLALIEAGNLDGLALGPVRVIDRLAAGPRESVFRVYDPRADREALLRWLAEAEMHDAIRPDEFRQRFAAAVAVRHPNVAATFEVLELAGRPAALQEWVTGVPGADWPPSAAAPGVWLRLVRQAAEALRAVHEAGLAHGALRPEAFVCGEDGAVKLCGVGEPRWLAAAAADGDGSPAADLRALGGVAAGWGAAPAKPGKARPLPEPLRSVIDGLAADAYPDAAALLGDLDRAAAALPAADAAWERFVRDLRRQTAGAAWRRSA